MTHAPQKSHVQPCLSDRPWPIGRSCDLQLETLIQAWGAGLRGLGRCRWDGWEGGGESLSVKRSDGQASLGRPTPQPPSLTLMALTVYSPDLPFWPGPDSCPTHQPAASAPHLCPQVEGLVLGLRGKTCYAKAPWPVGYPPHSLGMMYPAELLWGEQSLLAGGQMEEALSTTIPKDKFRDGWSQGWRPSRPELSPRATAPAQAFLLWPCSLAHRKVISPCLPLCCHPACPLQR